MATNLLNDPESILFAFRETYEMDYSEERYDLVHNLLRQAEDWINITNQPFLNELLLIVIEEFISSPKYHRINTKPRFKMKINNCDDCEAKTVMNDHRLLHVLRMIINCKPEVSFLCCALKQACKAEHFPERLAVVNIILQKIVTFKEEWRQKLLDEVLYIIVGELILCRDCVSIKPPSNKQFDYQDKTYKLTGSQDITYKKFDMTLFNTLVCGGYKKTSSSVCKRLSYHVRESIKMLLEDGLLRPIKTLLASNFITHPFDLFTENGLSKHSIEDVNNCNEDFPERNIGSPDKTRERWKCLLDIMKIQGQLIPPLPLLYLCRNKIRQRVINVNFGTDIERKLGCLDLPKALKDFVELETIELVEMS